MIGLSILNPSVKRGKIGLLFLVQFLINLKILNSVDDEIDAPFHESKLLKNPRKKAGFFLAKMTPKILLDEEKLAQTIRSLAESILKVHSSFEDILMVGIQTRGVLLAQRLRDCFLQLAPPLSQKEMEIGSLDISLYRDDLSTVAEVPIVKKTEIPVSIEKKGILLVDDVLYTGRTVRAALDALIDFGRPRWIELVALVDRGGRELPIQANFVGTSYQASSEENVQVCFQKTDGQEGILVTSPVSN